MNTQITVTRRGNVGNIEVTRRPVEFALVKPGENLVDTVAALSRHSGR